MTAPHENVMRYEFQFLIITLILFTYIIIFNFLLGGCKCCLALSSYSIVPLLFTVVMLYCLLWN